MKVFYIVLGCLMLARNAWLIHNGKFHRWSYAIFWAVFTAWVTAQRNSWSLVLCGLIVLILARRPLRLLLFVVRLIVPRLAGEVVRQIQAYLAVWLACWLGRSIVVVYADHPHLASLVETRVLPRVGPLAIVVRNSIVARRHRFHLIDRLASGPVVAALERVPAVIRLHPFSDAAGYDLRKALWMSRNGLPAELEQIIAEVLHPST